MVPCKEAGICCHLARVHRTVDSTTPSKPPGGLPTPFLVRPPDTHQVHRWVHSSPMDSGIQSQMALHGKSPRWHTGWRHRHAQLQNQSVSRVVPTQLKRSSPSPRDPEFTGVQSTKQGSEKRAHSARLPEKRQHSNVPRSQFLPK